jgi:hypothetical protein
MTAPRPRRAVSQQLLQAQNITALPISPTSEQHSPPRTGIPPLNLAQRRFLDSAGAHDYLERPYWRPMPKSHGVPQTEEDRLPYVKKIYDAIVDTDNCFDQLTFSTDKKRFDAGYGVWGTDPNCIEAVAHDIVETCMTLHNRGATGLALGRFPSLTQLHDADRKFTFAQRIHFMALLLRHFKFHANHVMQSNFTMQYLARIWSTLWELPGFQLRWNHMDDFQRAHQLHQAPYEDVPADVMTREEGEQFSMEAAQEHEQRRQRVLQLQQQAQIETALKRPIDAVQMPADNTPTKRRNVGMSSGGLAQSDLTAQELPAGGEGAGPAIPPLLNEGEQVDWETLFADSRASVQDGAVPQVNTDDLFGTYIDENVFDEDHEGQGTGGESRKRRSSSHGKCEDDIV